MAFEMQQIGVFLDELASDSPAPGGGSVAALGGALGGALVTMVSGLTIGREKYKDNWAEMESVRESSEKLRARLVSLMNEDTEAFNSLMAAMKLPKGTDEEKAARRNAMEEATKKATLVPLETLECCAQIAELANRAMKSGNPNAASDAGSAAFMAVAGGNAAAYNVRINLPGIKDEAFAAAVRERLQKALASLRDIAAKTEEGMNAILG